MTKCQYKLSIYIFLYLYFIENMYNGADNINNYRWPKELELKHEICTVSPQIDSNVQQVIWKLERYNKKTTLLIEFNKTCLIHTCTITQTENEGKKST